MHRSFAAFIRHQPKPIDRVTHKPCIKCIAGKVGFLLRDELIDEGVVMGGIIPGAVAFDHEQPGVIVRRNGQKLLLRQGVFRFLHAVGGLHLRRVMRVWRGIIWRGRVILAGAKAADEDKCEDQR